MVEVALLLSGLTGSVPHLMRFLLDAIFHPDTQCAEM